MEVSITAEMFTKIASEFAGDVSDSGEMIVSKARQMRKWMLAQSDNKVACTTYDVAAGTSYESMVTFAPVSVVMESWGSLEADAKVSAALAAL